MRRPIMPFRHFERQHWLLLAILVIALWLRLTTVGFGLPALNDPDELMFEMGALRMLRGPTLDPGWFGHPATTTMYVLAVINMASFGFALLSGQAASVRQYADLVYADPSWMILPGRTTMVLFALVSIYLTWRLARRFFGSFAGLVAAALLAVDPVHVTWSQIIRSDMMACVFMLLCLQSAIAVAERGQWRNYLSAACWGGVAIATKWPFALSFIAIVAATHVAIRDSVVDKRPGVLRLAAAGAAMVGVLIIISPYLLIDHAVVLENLQGEGQAHHLGANGGNIWENLRWYAAGPIFTGFGAGGAVLFTIGLIPLMRHRLAFPIMAPLAIAFILLLCIQPLVWERWALPLMPLGAIVAGAGAQAGMMVIERSGRRNVARCAAAVMLVISLLPLLQRIRADDAMRMNDTRQLASTWARAHIPPGSTILIEHFAFDILAQPWRFLFPMGDAGCVDVRAYLHGKISYATIERARGKRSNIDYGTVAPERRDSCRADFAILTQSDRYAQEHAHFAAEDTAYRMLIATGRIAVRVRPEQGVIGGPTVTILDLRR